MERLAAFASAYVRFAAQEPALFDITFHAGLDKSRFDELAAAGDEVARLLLPVFCRLAPDEDDAFDLLLRVAGAAHGLAVFLRQGLFGVGGGALADTEDKAARTARDIARQSCRPRWPKPRQDAGQAEATGRLQPGPPRGRRGSHLAAAPDSRSPLEPSRGAPPQHLGGRFNARERTPAARPW